MSSDLKASAREGGGGGGGVGWQVRLVHTLLNNFVSFLIFSGFFFPIALIGKFTAMIILHFLCQHYGPLILVRDLCRSGLHRITILLSYYLTRLTAAGSPMMRCKLSENLAIFIPIFLIIFKLDTDQIKQPRLFRFMWPEAKWNACRIDKRSDDDKIGLDRNIAIQVNLERFVWGHWGKTVLISSRQFALTGLFLWNLLPVPS